MTLIEYSDNQIYLSTTDRADLLEIIAFIQARYEKMETRDQKQVTIFEYRDIEPPPIVKGQTK